MGGGAGLEESSLGLHFGGEGEELMARMGSGQNMVVVSMILINCNKWKNENHHYCIVNEGVLPLPDAQVSVQAR